MGFDGVPPAHEKVTIINSTQNSVRDLGVCGYLGSRVCLGSWGSRVCVGGWLGWGSWG